jgi:predicted ABC-type ATPase
MMEKPKLLVIAGPNGSGKTSVTGKILKHQWVEGCEYINPDNIARDVFGDWNSPDAVMQAARHAATMREDCIDGGRSLIFETVLSAPDKISFVQRAKQKGYFVRLFFIGTDSPQINAARVADRLYVYDNSVDDVFPELLFRANNGKLIKHYTQIHHWATIIFRELS